MGIKKATRDHLLLKSLFSEKTITVLNSGENNLDPSFRVKIEYYHFGEFHNQGSDHYAVLKNFEAESTLEISPMVILALQMRYREPRLLNHLIR